MRRLNFWLLCRGSYRGDDLLLKRVHSSSLRGRRRSSLCKQGQEEEEEEKVKGKGKGREREGD